MAQSRFCPFLSPKKLSYLSLLLLAVAGGLFTGCHPKITDPKDPKFIVADKDDWSITREELDKEVSGYLQQHQISEAQVGPAKMPILETGTLKSMVLKKLILARAAKLPLKDVDKDENAAFDRIKSQVPNDKDFQDKLKAAGLTVEDLKKHIHEDVLARKVLDTEAFQQDTPTDQEINDFYLQNKARFDMPAKMRASRVLILVDDKTSPADKIAKKKAIDKAHDRVVKGEDLSKVATEVSEDKYSAPKGGDIGYFQRGENEAQFDEVAFKAKVGDLTPVFQTPMGYQFLKVTESQPAGVVSVADARASISHYLEQAKMRQQAQVYTEKLLATSGVNYHIPLVDPPAQAGAPASGAPATTAAPSTSTPSEPAANTPPSN